MQCNKKYIKIITIKIKTANNNYKHVEYFYCNEGCHSSHHEKDSNVPQLH